MIIPLNGHLVIEPLEHKEFIPSERMTYEEIGVVTHNGSNPSALGYTTSSGGAGGFLAPYPQVGDKVYFDSWMVSKFPNGKTGEFYWLVPYANVKAYEPVPKE